MAERKRRVIIESPYAGSARHIVEQNVRYLRACIRDSLLRGEAPFASHGLYTLPGVLDDTVRSDRDLGIEAGFAWRAAAEATVVYDDYGITDGMRRGIEHAREIEHVIEIRRLSRETMAGVTRDEVARAECGAVRRGRDLPGSHFRCRRQPHPGDPQHADCDGMLWSDDEVARETD